MAFQSGTQIRPELANADLSGFQRAAEIQGQMVAQLGQDIGKAVQGYREGKIKKERSEQRQFAVKGILNEMGVDTTTKDGEGIAKALSNNPDLFDKYEQTQMNQIKLDSIKQNEINTNAAIKALDLGFPAVEEGQTSQFDKNAYLDAFVGFGGNDLGVAGETLKLVEGNKEQSKLMQKVQDMLIANPDMSFTDALNYEVGLLKTATDPVTGKTSLIDISQGTSTPLVESENKMPEFKVDPVPEDQSIYGMGIKFTGAAESVKRAGQKLTGQIGLDVASDESIQAANYIKTAQASLVRAYRESGKFVASEDEKLRKEFDINIGPTVDAKTLKNNLIAINRSMDERYEEQKKIYDDPRSSAEDQASALRIARSIREFQSKLGIPDETKGKSSVSVDDELSSLVEYLTEEEKQQLGL